MKAILVCLFFLTAITAQAAQLTIPDTFEVLAVDGEKRSKSFFTRATELDLAAGQHSVQLQYREMFEDATEDDHQTVRSEPFVIMFSVSADAKLQLLHPLQADVEQAKAFATSPRVQLVDSNNQAIPVEQISQQTYEQELMSMQQQRRQQVVKKSLSDDPTEFTHQGPDNLEMMKYWWQQATDIERQEFIRYLQEEQQ
ncbi:YccT family protein [Thalassotalea mangrovi]|nr:DUF2057 domain-containing protein [Thalassotalea mangrovi]